MSVFPPLLFFSYPVGMIYFTFHCTVQGWVGPTATFPEPAGSVKPPGFHPQADPIRTLTSSHSDSHFL